MRFLIDTHVLVWYLDGSARLSNETCVKINDPSNIVVVSIVSLWELTIKMSLNKMATKNTLIEIQAHLRESRFNLLGISFNHLNTLSYLPHHHGDPFDRMLISQAITEKLTIISAINTLKLMRLI